MLSTSNGELARRQFCVTMENRKSTRLLLRTLALMNALIIVVDDDDVVGYAT